MRIAKRIVLAAVSVLATVTLGAAPIAAAEMPCPHKLGSAQRLVDAAGAVVQEWTVTDLRPSADLAPGYPLAGRLWEATATVKAVTGTVTPIIPNLRAVGAGKESYPVLWQVASPEGIPGATLAQGQSSSGKLYFDVTGPDPASVVYGNAGTKPLMMWCDMAAMMQPMSMSMSMMTMGDCPCCGDSGPCCGEGCPCCRRQP